MDDIIDHLQVCGALFRSDWSPGKKSHDSVYRVIFHEVVTASAGAVQSRYQRHMTQRPRAFIVRLELPHADPMFDESRDLRFSERILV